MSRAVAAQAAAAVVITRLAVKTGHPATPLLFGKSPAKHWRRPALVFKGRKEGTFEIDALK